jgi:glutaminase
MDFLVATRWNHWKNDGARMKRKKKFINRRRSIVTTINKYANQHNLTIETAVNIAEERHSRLNRSLHYLSERNGMIFD